MVTIEEINKEEQELNRLEQQNKLIASEKIPEKKYGSGVTKSVQQQYIERRSVATENIRKINEKRQELQDIKDKVITQQVEVQRYNEQVKQQQKEKEDWDRAFILYRTGQEWKASFNKSLLDKIQYLRITNYSTVDQLYKDKGIKVIVKDNKVVGFEDYKLGASVDIKTAPEYFNKIRPDTVKSLKEVGITFEKLEAPKDLKDSNIDLNNLMSVEVKQQRLTQSNPNIKGKPLQIQPVTWSNDPGQALLGSTKAKLKSKDYGAVLIPPITISQKALNVLSKTPIENINQFGESQTRNIAETVSLTYQTGKFLVTKQTTSPLAGLGYGLKVDTDETIKESIKQALIYKGGVAVVKNVNKLPAFVKMPTPKRPTDPTEILIKQADFKPKSMAEVRLEIAGKDIYNQMRDNPLGVPNDIRFKAGDLYYGTKRGIGKAGTKIKSSGVFNKLDDIENAILKEELSKVNPRVYKDIFYKSPKKSKVKADLDNYFKPLVNKINLDIKNNPLGVPNNIRYLLGDIVYGTKRGIGKVGTKIKSSGVFNKLDDYTYSALKNPYFKDRPKVKTDYGYLLRKKIRDFNKPSDKKIYRSLISASKIMDKPATITKQPTTIQKLLYKIYTPRSRKFTDKQLLKSLQNYKDEYRFYIDINKAFAPVSKKSNTAPKIIKRLSKVTTTATAISKGSYAGMGLYERTGMQAPTQRLSTGLGQRQLLYTESKTKVKDNLMLKDNFIYSDRNKMLFKPTIKYNEIERLRLGQSNPQRATLKSLQAQYSILSSKERLSLGQRQSQRQEQRLIQTPIPVQTTRLKTPQKPPIPRIDLDFKPKGKNSLMSKFSEGYKTYVIRKGKRVYLKGISPKSEAIIKGSTKVLNSLRATFGLTKTGTRVKENNRIVKPSNKLFRSYRIKKGKKVALNNIFIQRTYKEGGLKGGRIRSTGEKAELRKSIRRIKF